MPKSWGQSIYDSVRTPKTETIRELFLRRAKEKRRKRPWK